jgi:hypothetical protein
MAIASVLREETDEMPHDANGKVLQVGDEVVLRCIVKRVEPGESYCNVSIETLWHMPPYHEPSTLTALNTRQLELVSRTSPEPEEIAAPI